MKVLLFIGDHSQDTWSVRLGWWLTRLVQKGDYWRVTHVEAILAEHSDGTVDIASASLREGGVRVKEKVKLNPKHWIVIEAGYSTDTAYHWFQEHLGQKYDLLGAFASAFPIQWTQSKRWFCNQAVGASFGLKSPEAFGPSQFSAMLLTIGNDVTDSFFKGRQ